MTLGALITLGTLAALASQGRTAIGVTPATFVNEPATPENQLRRLLFTIENGSRYAMLSNTWAELEAQPQRLQELGGRIQFSASRGMKISFTLRGADTVARLLPPDLMNLRWNSEEMKRRALLVVEALAPPFAGKVKWFMFGNEVDSYFSTRPGEIADYAELMGVVAARLKQLSPGIKFSSTVQFAGGDALNGALRPLKQRMDFLSFTYYPMNSQFQVNDPGAAAQDVAKISGLAGGRNVVLQEAGYSTSELNGSSPAKQAEFLKILLRRAKQAGFAAVNVFHLADMSLPTARMIAGQYGLNTPEFVAFLQTIGLFDEGGNPKPAWEEFIRAAK
jgi:hypothetical protein